MPVWKSTSLSGAPDNSSLSHFSATTRQCWLRRAVRNTATPSSRLERAVNLISTQLDADLDHLGGRRAVAAVSGELLFVGREIMEPLVYSRSGVVPLEERSKAAGRRPAQPCRRRRREFYLVGVLLAPEGRVVGGFDGRADHSEGEAEAEGGLERHRRVEM